MGPEFDFEGLSAAMLEKQKILTSIHEDNSFNIATSPEDSAMLCSRSEGTVINVTDVVDSDDKGPFVSDFEELTESSSSFANTDSETADGPVSNGLGAKSELYDDGTSMHSFDRFNDLLMRKKRLTPHWRKFISPLMWRLKWTELKIRILETEAAKYGKKMAGYGSRKEHDLQELTMDEHSVKCSPIPCQNQRRIMKRQKRKCVDGANDILSYMSQHHLFSYHVNKKSSAGGAHADSHFATPVGKQEIPVKFNMDELDFNGGWPCLEYKDDEMLEDLLQKIELAKLQLDALKVRADKVVSENADRVCASERLGLVALQSHRCASDNPEATFTGPDAVKSTKHPHSRLASEKVEGEPLIYNKYPIKEEIGVGNQPSSASKPSTSVQQVQDEDQESNSQGKRSSVPSAKVRSLSRLNSPQNRRKRARRKGRSSRWTRRSSG